jgi:glycosyltransferase involved in cell wall biosynthesis
MPVYNGARYLDGAIRGILDQTFRDFELILVDDGSYDDTPRIMQAHAAADSRVIVSNGDHAGVAVALNRGFALARAPLIARMDSDDESLPDRLERQVKAMRALPGVAVLGTGIEIIDESGRFMKTIGASTNAADIREKLLVANGIAHPTVMLRRDAVHAAGGYRPIFTRCEDYDLWLRLSESHDISNLHEPLLRYRGHAGQISNDRHHLRQLEMIAAQHAARMRRAGLGDPIGSFQRIDAATLRAIGVPRQTIMDALSGKAVSAPPLASRFTNRRRH